MVVSVRWIHLFSLRIYYTYLNADYYMETGSTAGISRLWPTNSRLVSGLSVERRIAAIARVIEYRGTRVYPYGLSIGRSPL